MIATADLHLWAGREGLRFDQAEKDYVILLVLSALADEPSQTSPWVFKGGTCLRHCYYPNYRFSEDMDFTLAGERDPSGVAGVLSRVAANVRDRAGVMLEPREPQVDQANGQIETPLAYARGAPGRRNLPTVKVHISFREPLLTPVETRRVAPPHPSLPAFSLAAYSKMEIVAEKLRALLQQQAKWPRPRDLYDLWYITCLKGESFDLSDLRRVFAGKCLARGVTPDTAGLCSTQLHDWNLNAWDNQLVPMLQHDPGYERVWHEWRDRCQSLL